MSAIKKHIHKVLAAFLCACLLLSYNPAFGQVDLAFAEGESNDPNANLGLTSNLPNQSDIDAELVAGGEGEFSIDSTGGEALGASFNDGEASTVVTVSTFDGELRTACTNSFNASRSQIMAENSVFDELTVEATSARAKNAGSYTYVWTVSRDGAAAQAVPDGNGTIIDSGFNPTTKVSHSTVNLQALFGTSSATYADGHLYTFTCTVTCGGETATRTIEVATIGDDSYSKDRLDASDHTTALGKFTGAATLSSGPISGTELSSYKTPFDNAAAQLTTDHPSSKFTADEAAYQLGAIQSTKIEGAIVSNGHTFPAYLGEVTLEIPIDNKTATTETGKDRYTYQDGDSIWIINVGAGSSDVAGEIKYYQAVVYDDVDEEGASSPNLKAKFVINDTDGPFMPGYFAVAYSPDKLVETQRPVTNYTVAATITNADQGFGFINGVTTDSEDTFQTGSDAVYTLTTLPTSYPNATQMTNYLVQTVTFGLKNRTSDDPADVTVIEDGAFKSSATFPTDEEDDITFEYNATTGELKIKDAQMKTAYALSVTFTSKTEDLPADRQPFNVHVLLEAEDSAVGIGSSMVNVEFRPNNETTNRTYDVGELGNSNAQQTSGYVAQTLKGTTTTLTAKPNGITDDGKGFILKKILTSTDNTNWKEVSSVKNAINVDNTGVTGDDIYVKFVFGVTTGGQVVGTPYEATFVVASGQPGTIDLGSDDNIGTDGVYKTRFTKDQPGPQVTFVANTGYYADHVKVTNTDTGAVIHESLSLNNASETPQYIWTGYTSHDCNVTFEVYFTAKTASAFKLTIDSNIQHGSITPAGWTYSPTATYASQTSMPFIVTPDEGWAVGTVTVSPTDGSGNAETVSVANGNAAFYMPAYDATITATFVTGVSKPTDPLTFDLNVYVADNGLSSNSALSSLFSYASNVVASPSGNSNAIAVNDYRSSYGTVNGKTTIQTSVEETDDYTLSLKANTTYTPQYEVEKVLVAEYAKSGDTKVYQRATLYYQSLPAFSLHDIQANTDVIVYFKAIPTGQTATDYEWVTVTTTLNSTMASATYEGATTILKGSSLSNKITPKSGYEWVSLRSGADDVTVSGEAAYTHTLTSVQENITVIATMKQKGTETVPQYYVGASNADGSTLQNGRVSVTSGGNTNDLTPTGLPYDRGTNLPVTVTTNSGYKMADLTFNWTDNSVYAMARGNEIKFSTSSTVDSGWTRYDSGGTMSTMFATATHNSSWTITNLLCNVNIVPSFAAEEQQPDYDDNDYWSVTPTVKSGNGTITHNTTQQDLPLKFLKTSNSTVRISFTPGTSSTGAKLITKNVTVKKTTGNPLADAWEWIVGTVTGNNQAAQLEQQAITNGYVDITVNGHYTIEVDFGVENSTGNDTDPYVAVNVTGDSLKGKVMPASPLMVAKSGADSTQQFIVSPNKASNNMFYSVASVTVKWTDNNGTAQTREILPTNRTDSLLTWDTTYDNVFTLNVGSLGLAQNNLNAVTLEVAYSDVGDTSVGDGGGSSETPGPAQMKQVTVSVMADGQEVAGSANTGGVVAPRGTFEIMVGTNAKQLVLVSPAEGYEIDRITSGGYDNASYKQSAIQSGYFYVNATSATAENIVVYLKQQSLVDRSWTIDVEVDQFGNSNGRIVPSKQVLLQPTQTYYYSVNPTVAGVGVVAITDYYKDGNNWTPVPTTVQNSSNWDRPSNDSSVLPGFTVNPLYIGGKLVDRKIVVTFGNMSDYGGSSSGDYTTPNSSRVNIKVSTWGNGRSYLNQTISPNASLVGVYKTQGVNYAYTFYLPQTAIDAGYRIFCIEKNGVATFGSKSDVRYFATEGSVNFAYSDLTRTDNSLDIYCRQFTPSELAGGANSGAGNIDADHGSGGTIVTRTSGGTYTQVKSAYNSVGELAAAIAATEIADEADTVQRSVSYELGGDFGDDAIGGSDGSSNNNNNNQSSANEGIGGSDAIPTDFYMIPANGYLIDQVYLYNCEVVQYAWLAPKDITGSGDTRTERIALKYTLQLKDASKSGYLFATYKQGAAVDQDDKWGWDQIHEQEDTNALDHALKIEITPTGAVEALVSDTQRVDLMLDVANPNIALRPTTNKVGSGYTVTYNTVKIDPTTGEFSFVVGPLIKWDEQNNENSIIYTVDTDKMDSSKYNVTAKPISSRISNGADGDDSTATVADTATTKNKYYTNYEVSGKVAAGDITSAKELMLSVPLKQLTLDDGEYPEYTRNQSTPGATFTVTAVAGEGGSLTPTSTTASGSWSGGDEVGPWTDLASGTTVSFKVEPDEGYVLTGLSRGVNDCLTNGEYDTETGIVTFRVYADTTLTATFAKEGSEESMRSITIEVEGGNGTTSPVPGQYQVEKGTNYPITFVPDDGYVPYRIWVDGVQSFVSPTLTGWMLPAAWSNQTFKVQYALAGTTPSTGDYLNQAGQNLANQVGTTLTQTGDNPWPLVTLIVLAAGAVFAVFTVRRRKATAARVEKYSVTKRH